MHEVKLDQSYPRFSWWQNGQNYFEGHPPIWVFPKIGVPQNGRFIVENPIKMDDLGVPLSLEIPI